MRKSVLELAEENGQTPLRYIEVLAEAVLNFRLECAQHIEEVKLLEEIDDFDTSDLLFNILYIGGLDFCGPFLATAMGLPADPWPGLTNRDLRKMTRGRKRQAGKLGILIPPPAPGEARFELKLRASQHRAWLEQALDTRPNRPLGRGAS